MATPVYDVVVLAVLEHVVLAAVEDLATVDLVLVQHSVSELEQELETHESVAKLETAQLVMPLQLLMSMMTLQPLMSMMSPYAPSLWTNHFLREPQREPKGRFEIWLAAKQ